MPFAGFNDFDECKNKMMSDGKSEDSANRICGAIKAKVEGHTQDVIVLEKDEMGCVESYIKEFQDNGRPEKAWWDRCIDSVSKNPDVDNPEALCNWIFTTGKAKV